MTQPALECSSLVKSLGGKVVLNDLAVSVEPGEVVALVGASGSGKSTLLRSIAGLISPDSGEIRIQGDLMWSRRGEVPAEDRNVGLVFQDYALWPHMSVRQNLSFGLEVRGHKRERDQADGSTMLSRSRSSSRWRHGGRTSFPADSSSAWRSPAASRCGRACCCSTNL